MEGQPFEGSQEHQDVASETAAAPQPDHVCVQGHPCACAQKTDRHGCPLYDERGQPLHVV